MPVDDKLLFRLAKIQCTWDEMAAVCDCSADTLQRRFTDVVHRGWKAGKASLRRQQWKKAMEGNNTMLIFLGKQYLGQADNPNQPREDPQGIAREIHHALRLMEERTDGGEGQG